MTLMETCKKGCCNIYTKRNYNRPFCHWGSKKRRIKAGVFIYDNETHRVLLVESCGYMWGAPKGTAEDGEDMYDCALREVEEETGIKLQREQLTSYVYMKRHTYYFFVSLSYADYSNLEIQDEIQNNDCTGLTWIHINCVDCLNLNKHCKRLIREYCNKPRSRSI